MRRAPNTSVTTLLLVSLGLACAHCAGCAETSSGEGTNALPLTIESHDNLVSETGVLELGAGLLSIASVALVSADGNVLLIGPLTIDLAVPQQELTLPAGIPPGEYTGLQIDLAPASDGAETLDTQIRAVMTEEWVRASSKLVMTGSIGFPEGPRTIEEGSAVELHILLRGMFFYLAPLNDAVDGHYEAGENHRDFITMNLVNMFDLRVLP
jgi:hypothetical protein